MMMTSVYHTLDLPSSPTQTHLTHFTMLARICMQHNIYPTAMADADGCWWWLRGEEKWWKGETARRRREKKCRMQFQIHRSLVPYSRRREKRALHDSSAKWMNLRVKCCWIFDSIYDISLRKPQLTVTRSLNLSLIFQSFPHSFSICVLVSLLLSSSFSSARSSSRFFNIELGFCCFFRDFRFFTEASLHSQVPQRARESSV